MSEYERFLAIGQRRLDQPDGTGGLLEGKRVLVTGGTGCIGSQLVQQVLALHPAKVGSIAIGEGALAGLPGVHHYFGDIRDEPVLDEIMGKGWDVVFHTAAVREPRQAELDPDAAITTNVLGMRNVLQAAERHEVGEFVYASTGKAVRPHSDCVYTATKRIAEFLLSQSTIPFRSGGRFTHVVDNSVVHRNLVKWLRAGSPVRLHADGILFYVQSALESAQLLIGAAEYTGLGEATIHSIRDLGEPIDLTAMVHDMRQALCSDSEIVITGYPDGYEEAPFPGLYDPDNAWDYSPLINAFEADVASQPYPAVDEFPLHFGELGLPSRFGLDELAWQVMEASMRMVRPSVAARQVALCQGRPLTREHQRMLTIIAARALGGYQPGVVPAGSVPETVAP